MTMAQRLINTAIFRMVTSINMISLSFILCSVQGLCLVLWRTRVSKNCLLSVCFLMNPGARKLGRSRSRVIPHSM